MGNYLICDKCGSEKTGFLTVFCPQCDVNDTTTKKDPFVDNGYFSSWTILGSDTVIYDKTVLYPTLHSLKSDIFQFRRISGIQTLADIYLYSVKLKDLRLDRYPPQSTVSSTGIPIKIMTVDLIGVSVQYETKV